MRKLVMVLSLTAICAVAGQLKYVELVGGSYVDNAREIIRTSDNGYVIVGSTNSFGAGGEDMIIARFDRWGHLVWARTAGAAGSDGAQSVAEAGDGGFLVAGWTNSFGAGNNDIFLVKFNATGGIRWAKTIGGAQSDVAYHIVRIADNGFAIAGATSSWGRNYEDELAVRIDSLGNVRWATTIGWFFGPSPANETSFAIAQTVKKGYVVVGSSWSFGSNDLVITVTRLDTLGGLLWSRNIGRGAANADNAQGVLVTSGDGSG